MTIQQCTGVGSDVYTTAAVGDGVTDDRAAIQTALDDASAAAILNNGWATVRLEKGKTYRIIPTLLTPTTGAAKYICLAIPDFVDFDLNGSVLEAYHVQGSDPDGLGNITTIGSVIAPKNLHTANSNYGAASNWSIGNGTIQVSDQLANRTGNVMVFSRCENVRWHNLIIGGSLNHAFEIQSGRGLTVENVACMVQNHTESSPRIQFDHDGDAGAAKRSDFTPTCALEDVIFRGVKVLGFPTYSASYTRVIEFGHSNAGTQRNILFEDCEFDGIRGPTNGATGSDRHIIDFYTHNSAGYQVLENITIRRCKFNHDVAGGSDSACIAAMAGGFSKLNNLLIEDCTFTGTFIHGIIVGSAASSSPQDRHPELRRGITIRNNTFLMGTWASQESGGTYGPPSGGVETAGNLATAISAGSCGDVLIEGNFVIFPNAFTAGHHMARILRGFNIANNYSTILKKNRVEFWHRYSVSSPSTSAVFTGMSVDCDEIVNTLARPCHYVCDGFYMDGRTIGCSGNAADDTFTVVGTNWLAVDDYVRLDFSGSSGSAQVVSQTDGYQVRSVAGNVITLKDAGGSTQRTFSNNIGNCVIRLAYNWSAGYVEEALTAGVAAENRLTGYRQGVAYFPFTDVGAGGVNAVQLNMPLGNKMTAPVSLNATGTLALNDILTGTITSTTGAAVVGTTRTGTQLKAELVNVAIGGAHDFVIINTGSNTFTLSAGATVSIVGNAVVAATSTGAFRAKRSADTTWIIYRMN